MIAVSFSAPTTSTVSLCPEAIRPSATVSAYTYPGTPPRCRTPRRRSAPSSACRSHGGGREQPVGAGGGRGRSCRGPPAVTPAAAIACSLASWLEHGHGLLGPGDVALPDAGALDDPLVGGLERSGEVLVRDDVGRHGHADARHLGERARNHVRAAGSRCANSAAMCSFRPDVTAWRATRMPFLMALGLEDAVADDGDAAHAEQRRAAVRRVVEQTHELADCAAARRRRAHAPAGARRRGGQRTRRT